MTDRAHWHSDLRGFLARLLGWANTGAVDLALESVGLAAERRAALVLCGRGDLVPIAWSLHRRAVGSDRPFVVSDPRRGDTPASVRSPANYASCARAVLAALGGALCVRASRLPPDFAATVAQIQNEADLMLVVCADREDEASPLLVRPAPLRLPPLVERSGDMLRIIDEYGHDAVAELRVPPPGFTTVERTWVRAHAATSLAEIEKATLRLVAIRSSRNVSGAAARLGMAPVSLSRWIRRRTLPPMR